MAELINLENIYLFDGSDKGNWEYFLNDIKNESYSDKIVSSLLDNITNQPKNELNLDIIDYILDFGCSKIISLIAEKNFTDSILNLLKAETNAGEAIQRKVIYLTQKWAKKFSENSTLPSFQENYNILKSFNIAFPDDNFIMDTYNKYIGNSSNEQNIPQQPQSSNIPNENNQNNDDNQNPSQHSNNEQDLNNKNDQIYNQPPPFSDNKNNNEPPI